MRQELQKRQVAVKMRILLNRNVTEIYVNCGSRNANRNYHLLTTYGPPTDHLPITYRPLTDHLPTTYRSLTDYIRTTCRPPTDRFFYGAACSILPKCSLAKV